MSFVPKGARFRPSPPDPTADAGMGYETEVCQCQRKCQQNVTLSLLLVTHGNSGEILGSRLPAASGGSFGTGSGCFSFVVSGPPGTYGVYQSSDLSMPLPWNFVQNVTFTSTTYSITVMDCNAGNNPKGFYYLGPKGP